MVPTSFERSRLIDDATRRKKKRIEITGEKQKEWRGG